MHLLTQSDELEKDSAAFGITGTSCTNTERRTIDPSGRILRVLRPAGIMRRVEQQDTRRLFFGPPVPRGFVRAYYACPMRYTDILRRNAGATASAKLTFDLNYSARQTPLSVCPYPFLKKIFADGGYQGPEFQKALAKIMPHIETEIVKRSDHANGFVVLPRRWVVERTIAWLNRSRRLTRDWENLNRKALAFLRLASIRLMLRKLCNPARCSPTDSAGAF